MRSLILVLLVLLFFIPISDAQKKRGANKDSVQKKEETTFKSSDFSALKLRNVGPAFTSGRIADIAIHPDNDNIWYVAVGSGGVWKTVNSGVTWTPIFDRQSVYSTGCITLDPSNPHTVWLGTGENVGGRHVAFGDGVYRSSDDGKTWKNMGLKKSEHVSKIIVHPTNSDIVWVAAQGPLWSKGGERGLYKTVDGGANWKKVLGDEEWTGVTDIVLDPRNPDMIYAATWQRHRTVAAYMGGGPNSGLHRSFDGGESWEKLSRGLPRSVMGKIGLAISPQQPDVIYAAIETVRTKGGIYKSVNKGASWQKQSDAVSGGTGPHYYQELYCSPHQFDKIYLMDVRIQVSEDGGKTVNRLPERGKHSDNHAIAFRKDDPNYLLVGSDGGLYESFDDARNWRFIDNMPITQYYKVAVDDAEPFYYIYGGTQDNGSHGGPSQTDNRNGIRNADWFKTLGADGHQSATEPGNPNIIYAETQQGGMHRIDRLTGEQVYIQPQNGAGDDYERFNWDAPIIVSPHDPATIYFASQRVWKSENRGDSWIPISGDLTLNQERIELPIMGKLQSWDNPWDMNAMSNYNTITSLAESNLQPGLVWAGTDDGLIHVSTDHGANWTKIEASSLPGVPSTAFVNDIKTDLFDINTVYVALDNHKYGDFKPYFVKSSDLGKTWTDLSSNLPKTNLVWRIVQDHEKANLLFLATEFGMYFTLNGGLEWVKLGGAPTISFRDAVIQRRENDLVCASFGRSFFVLDDYSLLRDFTEETLAQDATLFKPGNADWYIPKNIVSSQGSAKYSASNPPFGARINYYLSEGYTSKKDKRIKSERELAKGKEDIPFPGWDALDEEKMEEAPKIWLTIKDEDGQVVRKISAPVKKGLNSVNWDLRYVSKRPVRLESENAGNNPFRRQFDSGAMVVPGRYSVSLSKQDGVTVEELSVEQSFEVIPLRDPALPRKPNEIYLSHMKQLDQMQTEMAKLNYKLSQSGQKINAMRTALARADIEPGKLDADLFELKSMLQELRSELYGSSAKNEIGERNPPTVQSRYYVARRGISTTYGPTDMHIRTLEVARDQMKEIKDKINRISNVEVPKLEQELAKAGAPWIEGQTLPGKS